MQLHEETVTLRSTGKFINTGSGVEKYPSIRDSKNSHSNPHTVTFGDKESFSGSKILSFGIPEMNQLLPVITERVPSRNQQFQDPSKAVKTTERSIPMSGVFRKKGSEIITTQTKTRNRSSSYSHRKVNCYQDLAETKETQDSYDSYMKNPRKYQISLPLEEENTSSGFCSFCFRS